MALFDFLFGSGDKLQQVPTLSSDQNQLLSQILSQLGMLGPTGQGYNTAQKRNLELLEGDQASYDRFADPYLRQYYEQILPRLAEQYAGGAQGGALSSSGFAQALGASGAGLQSNLASLRGNLQQNAIQNAFGQYGQLSGIGLSAQPFGYQSKQGSAGFIPTALGSALGGFLGRF